ncbi:hypothetical protein H0H81_010612 [Sphagnurus paluster]|uniref:Uncharacterized protein n=1 Tax=Sphagnurus paluster TaxID=117069 RepID=A0A9P7KIF3_9AGAR|nr:hypothetical protein H0H81_010612 [Sphagnurus paluster]
MSRFRETTSAPIVRHAMVDVVVHMSRVMRVQITLNELAIPFFFVVSSVFANRLLIGVRLAYYGEMFGIPENSMVLPDFADESTSDGATEFQSRIELTTFNERIGT